MVTAIDDTKEFAATSQADFFPREEFILTKCSRMKYKIHWILKK